MALFNYVNPLYYAVAWTVMHSIWQIAIVAIVAASLQGVMQRYRASSRYQMLVGAALLICVVSFCTFWYYYTDANPGINYNAANQNGITTVVVNAEGKKVSDFVATSPESLIARLDAFVNKHLDFIVLVWFVGMVLALLRLIGKLSYVFYLRHNFNFPVDDYWSSLLSKLKSKYNYKPAVEVVESALVRSPIVIGYLKPMILFPIGIINKLAPEEVEAILAHELAHLTRHDYLINIVLQVIESIYYYHPAVWWLYRQISEEREHSCDDAAIQVTQDKLAYAKSLVAIQEMSMVTPHLSMAFAGKNKHTLLQRVSRLFPEKSRAVQTYVKLWASGIVMLGLMSFALTSTLTHLTPDCLPTDSIEGTHYLKYQLQGKLDSLELDIDVEDGNYIFADDVHDLSLKIENHRVVEFNLNGLEVDGRDIPKFKSLIQKVLVKQDVPETTEDEEDPYSIKFYDNLASKLKQDKLLPTNGMNHISIDAENFIINGKKQNKTLHKKYLELIATWSNKKSMGDRYVSFVLTTDKYGESTTENILGSHIPPAPPKPSNAVDQPPVSVPQPQSIKNPPPPPPTHKAYNYTYSGYNSTQVVSSNDQYTIWLDKELMNDGYIDDPKNYMIYWDLKNMLVNGKSVDQMHIKKYLDKMEEMTGTRLTKGSSISRVVNND